jgi:hypothetical protein
MLAGRFDAMREINERRGIGSSGHRNPTNVTLGPESLGSVWDLQPPAGACKFTGHRPANIKGGRLARVSYDYRINL